MLTHYSGSKPLIQVNRLRTNVVPDPPRCTVTGSPFSISWSLWSKTLWCNVLHSNFLLRCSNNFVYCPLCRRMGDEEKIGKGALV